MYQITIILLLVCGAFAAPSPQEVNPFISGGSDAQDGQFPFMASLQLISNGQHKCGGAILNKRWIITAGFCTSTDGFYGELQASLGSVYTDAGVLYDIERYETHPSFNYEHYDIGLVRVNSDIIFNIDVYPISIDYTSLQVNTNVVTMGYGSGGPPTLLQFLTVLAMSNTECSSILDLDVTNEVLCTISLPGAGSCSYDDGNPMILNNALVAIKSKSYNMCGDAPDVSTRLSDPFVQLWVENIIYT